LVLHQQKCDECGKHGSRKSKQSEIDKKYCLKNEENRGEGVCLYPGDDPARRSEDDSENDTEQDLYYSEEMRENGHKLTEMYTNIVQRGLN